MAFADAYMGEFIASWSDLTLVKKPIIAAVDGYAVSRRCMIKDVLHC